MQYTCAGAFIIWNKYHQSTVKLKCCNIKGLGNVLPTFRSTPFLIANNVIRENSKVSIWCSAVFSMTLVTQHECYPFVN